MHDLLQGLAALGFSPYEARAYIALVKHSPANGYEVAKAAEIPTSKIYETLQRLQSQGAVRLFASDPVRYAATPPVDLLATFKARFKQSIDVVSQGFRNLPSRSDATLTWVLDGETHIIDAMQRAIERSSTSLFAALWETEVRKLERHLLAAEKRGVEIQLACYGKPPASLSNSYDLSLCGISAEERLGGKRLTAVVRDSRESVTAIFEANGAHGIWTENAVLSVLATEYIREEIMGRTIIDALGEDAYQTLRQENPTLRSMLRFMETE